MPRFTYAVLADSHFHAPPGSAEDVQHGYPSDASFNARTAAAVTLLQRVRPAFAVHLGDLAHPVPGLAAHEVAMDAARETLSALPCPLHVVPGNHDIGDKPHAWAPAPGVTSARHAAFAARWNPPWWVVDHGDLRLVGIDTPVLNSGLPEETEQWAWLAEVLATDKRVHAFLHYPPFLLEPDEDEHYDNLAEPARGRLLDLLSGVEAAFCGHVHHPFWHRDAGRGGPDWYLLPGLAFVRPGFSELAPLPPGPEHGRDDAGRLGLCLVHVEADGHRTEWVWTEGATSPRAWAPGLGPGAQAPRIDLHLTLRHAWDQVHSVPADNLDPYRRKAARFDLPLLRAWGLGATTLRLPLSDLRDARTRARMGHLADHGFSFVLFAAALPTTADRALLEAHAGMVAAVELILPDHLAPPGDLPVPLWLSRHHKAAAADTAYFDHFPADGFSLSGPVPPDLPAGAAVVLRVPPEVPAFDAAAAADALDLPGPAVLRCWLPRAGEGTRATDDRSVARIVAQAALLAHARPDLHVGLETFVDHDRGYFPRNGLVDRRGDPRAGWRVLRSLSRLLPVAAGVEALGEGAFRLGDIGVVRISDAPRPGICLVDGTEGEGVITLERNG